MVRLPTYHGTLESELSLTGASLSVSTFFLLSDSFRLNFYCDYAVEYHCHINLIFKKILPVRISSSRLRFTDFCPLSGAKYIISSELTSFNDTTDDIDEGYVYKRPAPRRRFTPCLTYRSTGQDNCRRTILPRSSTRRKQHKISLGKISVIGL